MVSGIYPVIFNDYAPNLLPDEYLVTCALSEEKYIADE